MSRTKGLPKCGGRKKGTPNKATKEVRAIAQEYGEAAIAELARLMTQAESEAARVAAAKEILDRAYGKSPQAIVGDPNAPLRHEIRGVSWMTEGEAKARGWA